MALIVETGSGAADAESYASVANADAYWLARNDTVWSALVTAAKEAALREATLYLEGSYYWIGHRTLYTQALNWPRVCKSGVDLNGKNLTASMIPTELVKATCELAWEVASNGRLTPSLSRGGLVKSKAVGPIKVEYEPGAPSRKTFPIVDTILRPIVVESLGSLSSEAVRG